MKSAATPTSLAETASATLFVALELSRSTWLVAVHSPLTKKASHHPGGCRKSFGVYPALSLRAAYAPPNRRWPMILNALALKLKRQARSDFKGRHFEATL